VPSVALTAYDQHEAAPGPCRMEVFGNPLRLMMPCNDTAVNVRAEFLSVSAHCARPRVVMAAPRNPPVHIAGGFLRTEDLRGDTVSSY
jgi:hypothetical protein